MSTRLEERYRTVLRLLPASYREVWEDDMVATYLTSVATDDLEEAQFRADFGRPSWSEVASVLALAVRLRIGGVAGSRQAAWGDAIRLVAVVGVLVYAVGGAAGVVVRLWLTGKLPLLPAPPAEVMFGLPTDFWRTAWDVAGLLWVATLLAVLVGHWRAAQVLALIGLVPDLVAAVLSIVDSLRGAPSFTVTIWSSLFLTALVVAALGTFRPGAPRPRPGPWLVAFGAGAVLLPVLMVVTSPVEGVLVPLDWPAVLAIAIVVAAVAARPRDVAWSLALAVLAALVFGLRVITLADYLLYLDPAMRPAMLTWGLAEAVAVLAVGVPLAVRAARRLRGLNSAISV